MAQAVAGMDKRTLAKALSGAGTAFGALSIVAPREVAHAYGVPVTPGGLQLQRLFGSRSLVISAMGLTAQTEEEIDRGLLAVAAMNALDAVTALAASARGTTRKTTIRAIASSVVYGGAALGIRSMKAAPVSAPPAPGSPSTGGAALA
jgi:hypothetical protein